MWIFWFGSFCGKSFSVTLSKSFCSCVAFSKLVWFEKEAILPLFACLNLNNDYVFLKHELETLLNSLLARIYLHILKTIFPQIKGKSNEKGNGNGKVMLIFLYWNIYFWHLKMWHDNYPAEIRSKPWQLCQSVNRRVFTHPIAEAAGGIQIQRVPGTIDSVTVLLSLKTDHGYLSLYVIQSRFFLSLKLFLLFFNLLARGSQVNEMPWIWDS